MRGKRKSGGIDLYLTSREIHQLETDELEGELLDFVGSEANFQNTNRPLYVRLVTPNDQRIVEEQGKTIRLYVTLDSHKKLLRGESCSRYISGSAPYHITLHREEDLNNS